ncbi:carboxypeptidase-like regulatory domain-containing protein [Bacteroidota bacterium]
MRNKKHRKNNFFLAVLLCCAIPAIILYSCKVQKVGPISPEPLTPEEAFRYVSGTIIDYDTKSGIEGVSITFGTISGTTDADGNFTITSELSAGMYEMVAQLEDYVTIYRDVDVSGDDDVTLIFYFEMKLEEDEVPITAAAGGTISETLTNPDLATVDTTTVVIPAGALTGDTQITVTPVPLIAATRWNIADPGYIPVATVSLEPHGSTFNSPLEVTVPAILPPASVLGASIIIKTTDPNTGITENLAGANPRFSADLTKIIYDAPHFSVDQVTINPIFRLVVNRLSDEFTYETPSTFNGGENIRFANCEETGTKSGNITITASKSETIDETDLRNNWGGYTWSHIAQNLVFDYYDLNDTQFKSYTKTTTSDPIIEYDVEIGWVVYEVYVINTNTSAESTRWEVRFPYSIRYTESIVDDCDTGHIGG